MKVKLVGERVLLKLDDLEEKTESGIFLPLMSQEKPLEGVVVALGPDTTELSIGNRVRYAKHSGMDITVEGEVYLLTREADILLILS